ncbi:MAG: 50S ribosomal protein L6 [Candidatus Omnitrophica bacterium CG11_big_fil_rev_8_21_14_0_20_64_10]|nr:MAG: 50S ribosomal protein L6 [Candidatus Omnitrophica bacterium CG11_big_fil_rev_8_21_14_0_20_64_10]
MSRVGRLPIPIPSGVKVEIRDGVISVEGSKGKLSHRFHAGISAEQKDGVVEIKRASEVKTVRELHGLTRTIVYNMIQGVTQGFSKTLELSGVGYRASMQGKRLELFVGFSHPVFYDIPDGVTVQTPKPTQVTVQGNNKWQVGQVAARIREVCPPEPYGGKGIKYSDEVIRRKAGKTVG